MFNVIAVVLGLVAIVVYAKAVKYGKEWGTPVMTILVLGAVAAVILPMTGLEERLRREERRFASERMLGEALAPRLSEGANILLILPPDDLPQIKEAARYRKEMEDMDEVPPEMEAMEEVLTLEEYIAEKKRDFKVAFEEGAGFSVNIVDSGILGRDVAEPSVVMENPGAYVFNETLADLEDGNIDAIISQAGLPYYRDENIYELEHLECFDWADQPIFAATRVGSRLDPDVLRDYIQEDLLTAIIMSPEPGGDRRAITSENLDDLPDSSPK